MWAGEEATVLRQTLPQSPLYILMMCTAHEADLISATPAAHTHVHTHNCNGHHRKSLHTEA